MEKINVTGLTIEQIETKVKELISVDASTYQDSEGDPSIGGGYYRQVTMVDIDSYPTKILLEGATKDLYYEMDTVEYSTWADDDTEVTITASIRANEKTKEIYFEVKDSY